MKQAVLDELVLFATTRANIIEARPVFKYIDEKKLSKLCAVWSTQNYFAYQFPMDVLRKIFNAMSPREYFRLAHGLCTRMRRYAMEDLIVLRVVATHRNRTYSCRFTLYNRIAFDNDVSIVIPHRDIWYTFAMYKKTSKASISIATARTRVGQRGFTTIHSFKQMLGGRYNHGESLETFWSSHSCAPRPLISEKAPPPDECYLVELIMHKRPNSTSGTSEKK